MDIIIDWRPYNTEFAGEKVTMDLLPLLTSEYKLLGRMFQRSDDNASNQADNIMDIIGKSEPILSRTVRNIVGVTVNGQPPTAVQLSEEAQLMILSRDILQELFLRSMVGIPDAKKLDPQSGSSGS